MPHSDAGYSVVEQVFARSEMAVIIQELSAANLERTKAGARHVLRVPAVRALADDPRMRSIAREFVGPAAVPFRATLFDKSSNANWLVVWHQDTALPLRARVDQDGWGPWSTKAGILYAHAPAWALEQVVALRVSLDDSLATNGPLRVLPDTHRGGVFSDEQIAQMVRSTPPLDCIARVGRRRRDAAADDSCLVQVHRRPGPPCPAYRVRRIDEPWTRDRTRRSLTTLP